MAQTTQQPLIKSQWSENAVPPRPLEGGFLRTSAAEKFQTLRYHNSSVFESWEVILGVLSIPEATSEDGIICFIKDC